jgi:hypothetical protein
VANSRVTFHGTRYRSIAPAELAHVLVETFREGRAQSMAKLNSFMGSSMLPNVDFTQQHDGAWGNDNMGSHFASGYVPGANQAKENCQTILDNVGTLSGDLVTVVERFHSTDCENANNTSKAGSSQGPWRQTYMPGSVTGPGPVVP